MNEAKSARKQVQCNNEWITRIGPVRNKTQSLRCVATTTNTPGSSCLNWEVSDIVHWTLRISQSVRWKLMRAPHWGVWQLCYGGGGNSFGSSQSHLPPIDYVTENRCFATTSLNVINKELIMKEPVQAIIQIFKVNPPLNYDLPYNIVARPCQWGALLNPCTQESAVWPSP